MKYPSLYANRKIKVVMLKGTQLENYLKKPIPRNQDI